MSILIEYPETILEGRTFMLFMFYPDYIGAKKCTGLSHIHLYIQYVFFSILSYYVGHNALLHLTFTLVLYGKFLTSFFFF